MADLCGDVWPDEEFDGRPISCHLDKGHGGLWHRWDHEHHVQAGEAFGDGVHAWPTALGYAAMGNDPLTPSVVPLALPFVGPHGLVTHEVVLHPKHVQLHAQMPPKPRR